MSTQSLATVLQHAEVQRDQALAAMLQAEDAVRRLQLQGEQLQAYRLESLQRNPAQGGRSTSVEMLRYHQGFMQRLDQAIDQQQAQTESTQVQAGRLRAALIAQETRVASVRKLMERRSHEALMLNAKMEQRRMDEAASRRSPALDSGMAQAWRSDTRPAPL